MPLRARLCLASSPPPVECRSSVLGIVTGADDTVLFLNPAGPSGTIAHFLFGGRPQPGETLEETLRTEVAEESGWHVEPKVVIGFRHFRHLGPPHPKMADRPYPDFVQTIYASTALAYDSSALLPGEEPCEFVDAEWAFEVTEPGQRPLLVAAFHATGVRLGS